ncbi:WD40 repeat-like protein [Cystobasidium minutum MCA 4210]|uniref:WD40 repeat-like protein n=1 Tax=Cystobasidium minutum MCA 4210 TaxID=1397322 RepID=UPI0034CE15E5|eukprot:jgi/Rhomi1/189300/estExt_fgenesh1_pg.C_3_t20287
MQADSTDTLFQSDAELAKSAARQEKAARTARAGSPIKLSSKPLDLAIRPRKGAAPTAFVAESGFTARNIDLKTGKTLKVYKGHSGPVTSLAFHRISKLPRELLITGSWDKSIRLWDVESAQCLSINHQAHTDFVKSLLVIPELNILLSGGSDKDLRIWDLAQLADQDWSQIPSTTASSSVAESVTSKVSEVVDQVKESLNLKEQQTTTAPQTPFSALPLLKSLKGQHTRPIEAISYNAVLSVERDNETVKDTGKYALWSADSMGRICIWELSRNASGLQATFKYTWLAHETAIYEIRMAEEECWTVSSDHLATLWSFNVSKPEEPPVPVMRLPHPYFVKTILPLPELTLGQDIHYAITGSTDEQIRIWDLSLVSDHAGEIGDGSKSTKHLVSAADAADQYKDGKKPPGMVYELEGHFHEVIKLAVWSSTGETQLEVEDEDELSKPSEQREETYIVSAGLDCTLRKWRLRDGLELAKAAAKSKNKPEDMTDVEKETLRDIRAGRHDAPKTAVMTAEEERELAELMGE